MKKLMYLFVLTFVFLTTGTVTCMAQDYEGKLYFQEVDGNVIRSISTIEWKYEEKTLTLKKAESTGTISVYISDDPLDSAEGITFANRTMDKYSVSSNKFNCQYIAPEEYENVEIANTYKDSTGKDQVNSDFFSDLEIEKIVVVNREKGQPINNPSSVTVGYGINDLFKQIQINEEDVTEIEYGDLLIGFTAYDNNSFIDYTNLENLTMPSSGYYSEESMLDLPANLEKLSFVVPSYPNETKPFKNLTCRKVYKQDDPDQPNFDHAEYAVTEINGEKRIAYDPVDDDIYGHFSLKTPLVKEIEHKNALDLYFIPKKIKVIVTDEENIETYSIEADNSKSIDLREVISEDDSICPAGYAIDKLYLLDEDDNTTYLDPKKKDITGQETNMEIFEPFQKGNIETIVVKNTLIKYPISYTATETATEVTFPNVTTFDATYEGDLLLLKAQAKHYEFKGWQIQDETGAYNTESSLTINSKYINKHSSNEIHLKAIFEEKKYTAIVHSDYTLSVNTMNYTLNTPDIDAKDIVVTSNTLKNTGEGYTFKGVYSDKKYENEIDSFFINDEPVTDIYLLFEPNEYTININSNGGILDSTSMKVKYGKSFSIPIPTREGYIFKGYVDLNNNPVSEAAYDYIGDITAKATWEKQEEKKEKPTDLISKELIESKISEIKDISLAETTIIKNIIDSLADDGMVSLSALVDKIKADTGISAETKSKIDNVINGKPEEKKEEPSTTPSTQTPQQTTPAETPAPQPVTNPVEQTTPVEQTIPVEQPVTTDKVPNDKKTTEQVKNKAITIKAVKAANKKGLKLKVTWKKNSACKSYKVQISLKKSMKSAKTYKATTASKIIKNLLKGKTYYVRVRGVQKNGKMTKWSSSVKVTIKK